MTMYRKPNHKSGRSQGDSRVLLRSLKRRNVKTKPEIPHGILMTNLAEKIWQRAANTDIRHLPEATTTKDRAGSQDTKPDLSRALTIAAPVPIAVLQGLPRVVVPDPPVVAAAGEEIKGTPRHLILQRAGKFSYRFGCLYALQLANRRIKPKLLS